MPRAFGLKLKQFAKVRRERSAQIFGCAPESVQIFPRDINATHLKIVRDITNDIRELKGKPETLGKTGRPGIVETKNMQACKSHSARDAIAIFREAVESGIGGNRQIHFRAR